MMRRCHLCGAYAYRGFTKRWLDSTYPVWVCVRVRECEERLVARLSKEPTDAEAREP